MKLKTTGKASKSHPLSVLMVSTFPPDRDGIASYTFRLADALRKEHVVTINAVNGREWKRNTPLYIFSIIRKAIASKTRIVHVQLSYFMFGNEYYTGLFPVLSFFLKLLGKSVIITFHDIVPKSKITNDFLKNYTSARLLKIKGWALFHFTRIVCLIADKLVIHSENARNVLVRDYAVSTQKLSIIPHGIDNLSIGGDKEGKSKSLVGEDCQLVSYFGLVRNGKGLEDLVRAWKKIENLNKHLFIIGGQHPALRDDCYDRLAALIRKLELQRSIRFCGFVPTASLPSYFNESDAFVFPYNQWGDVIASSGALSMVAPYLKPIVATDVPAFDDLKKKGAAIIVQRGDIDGLASAISEVLNDTPTRKSLVTRLNEWLLEVNWANVAKRTAAMYRELV